MNRSKDRVIPWIAETLSFRFFFWGGELGAFFVVTNQRAVLLPRIRLHFHSGTFYSLLRSFADSPYYAVFGIIYPWDKREVLTENARHGTPETVPEQTRDGKNDRYFLDNKYATLYGAAVIIRNKGRTGIFHVKTSAPPHTNCPRADPVRRRWANANIAIAINIYT